MNNVLMFLKKHIILVIIIAFVVILLISYYFTLSFYDFIVDNKDILGWLILALITYYNNHQINLREIEQQNRVRIEKAEQQNRVRIERVIDMLAEIEKEAIDFHTSEHFNKIAMRYIEDKINNLAKEIRRLKFFKGDQISDLLRMQVELKKTATERNSSSANFSTLDYDDDRISLIKLRTLEIYNVLEKELEKLIQTS